MFGLVRMRQLAVAAVLVLGGSGASLAEDVPGSADHPLVGRYDGSTITDYKVADYDEAYVLVAPNDWTAVIPNNDTDHSGKEWLALEGKVFTIRYDMPENRSSLEVLRNYQLALKKNGFTEVFSCKDGDCFTGTKDKLPYQMGRLFDPRPGADGRYWDHARYYLGKLARPKGTVYAMVLVGEKGENALATIKVIETGEMETDKIVVKSAAEMNDDIVKAGSTNIYTLYFDTDKADLKPEAGPTLDEIAKLLTDEPTLKLQIVGHTDNQGSADYNLDLSKRRAAAVVAALVSTKGIAADRLTSDGQGLNKPIASNDTEEGRAQNRRVELVRMP